MSDGDRRRLSLSRAKNAGEWARYRAVVCDGCGKVGDCGHFPQVAQVRAMLAQERGWTATPDGVRDYCGECSELSGKEGA